MGIGYWNPVAMSPPGGVYNCSLLLRYLFLLLPVFIFSSFLFFFFSSFHGHVSNHATALRRFAGLYLTRAEVSLSLWDFFVLSMNYLGTVSTCFAAHFLRCNDKRTKGKSWLIDALPKAASRVGTRTDVIQYSRSRQLHWYGSGFYLFTCFKLYPYPFTFSSTFTPVKAYIQGNISLDVSKLLPFTLLLTLQFTP